MREKWKQSKTVTYYMGKDRSQKIPLKPVKPDSLKKKRHYKRFKYKGNITRKTNIPKYQKKFLKERRTLSRK